MNNSIDLIKKYTKQNNIVLTSRGNTAIFAALSCAKELNKSRIVLYPDQGGWFSYFKYPKKLGMESVPVKTDYGILDLDDLKEKVKIANCLIYSNPAGYFAEQPIKEIYEICKNKCLVTLDVTGCIGDKELCNGEFADFAVCSFGEWKPIDLGYGGFVSSKKGLFRGDEDFFDGAKFDESYSKGLYEKLNKASQRLNLLYKPAEKIKEDLKNFDIIHRNKRGINVMARFKNDCEKNRIIEYCEKNKYEFTLCPRYIRVNEKAISIEIKRL